MASNRKYKWDRLSVEDDADYTLFLTYRNMGPRRNLRAAYRAWIKTLPNANTSSRLDTGVPDRWRRLSKENRWPERAAAWDVSSLQTVGCRLVALHSDSILKLAKRANKAAGRVVINLEDSRDVLEILKACQQYLTPETVGGAASAAQPLPEAVPEVAGSVE